MDLTVLLKDSDIFVDYRAATRAVLRRVADAIGLLDQRLSQLLVLVVELVDLSLQFVVFLQ